MAANPFSQHCMCINLYFCIDYDSSCIKKVAIFTLVLKVNKLISMVSFLV